MYDNRYESHVTTGMTQELTFGYVSEACSFALLLTKQKVVAMTKDSLLCFKPCQYVTT